MGEAATASEVLGAYFQETMSGDLTAVDRYFAEEPDYVMICRTNSELAAILPWVGAQTDREGIKQAYGRLLAELEVLDASQEVVFDSPRQVAIEGRFTYRARSTGAVVDSDWSVFATVGAGGIEVFRYYEDSYAVASAFRVSGQWAVENRDGTATVPSE